MKKNSGGARVCTSRIWAILGMLMAIAFLPTQANAQFYKGKTVTMLIGYDAGGGNDIRGRLVARYLEKYIPGNPRIIVQNMPGASGLIEVNYLNTNSAPDGLTIADVDREDAFVQVGGGRGVRFNAADFGWIGGLSQEAMVVFVRSSLPYKTLDDLRKAKQPLFFGVRQVGATNYLCGKALQELGVPVKIVNGYAGNEFTMAFERGEVDSSALTMSSFANRPQWIKPGGLATLVLTLGGRQDGVPYGLDQKPVGQDTDLYKLINLALGVPNAMYAAPPKTPPERLAELQKAFMAMVADPEFKADAAKIGIALKPMDGQTVSNLVSQFVDSPPEAKAKFGALLK